jgi:ABC-type nitrate/sulfonate/bicarbonate transport system permease component
MWLRKLIIYLIAIGLCGAGLGFFAGQASLGYRTGDAEAIFAGLFVGGLLGFAGIALIVLARRKPLQSVDPDAVVATSLAMAIGSESGSDSGD